jgi:hypothetical protein
MGHRTFRVHAILIFFALVDLNITKFMVCELKVFVFVTVLSEIQSKSSYSLNNTGNYSCYCPLELFYIFKILNLGR